MYIQKSGKKYRLVERYKDPLTGRLKRITIGLKDKKKSTIKEASIVLTKGTEGTDELKKEIQNYVKMRTAPYKYPRIIDFRTELPKTVSGKIQRNKL